MLFSFDQLKTLIAAIVYRHANSNGHILCVELFQGAMKLPYSDPIVVSHNGRGPGAIAIDCEMVGGGDDGTLDLCALVCLIDEDENVIFHTYVRPQIPVTNYRYLYALYRP